MIENVVPRGSVFTLLAECRNRGPVGGTADEDLENFLWIDLSTLTEVEGEFLSESVGEKVKDLIFRYCIGCWSRVSHTFDQQPSFLVNYYSSDISFLKLDSLS